MSAGKKNQLIEKDPLIHLNITLNKIPLKKNPKPFHMYEALSLKAHCVWILTLLVHPIHRLLPHSLNTEAEICVFVKDPAKEAKDFFRSHDIPNVKKVHSQDIYVIE